jgi:predicted Zn-dependent peptidase
LAQTSQVNGMNLHVLPTDKFKTTVIIVNIQQELKEDTVTMSALLPFVLKRGSQQFPQTQQLRQHLDSLFGAVFHADVMKKGEKQIIQIQLELANEKYLRDSTPLLSKGIEFLGGILTRPYLVDGAFSADYVRSEAEILKKKISALVDDKIRYANQRVTEEMCKDEPYRFLAYGQMEELEKIGPKELYTYYEDLLAKQPIDIYVTGDVSTDEVKQLVAAFFPNQRQATEPVVFAPIQKDQVTPKTVIEEMQIGQGKLNIGCRTFTTIADDDFTALLVCNGILGGFPHSKLFVNVREKASLAYYAVSRLESHKGILMMMSGIEVDKYEQAVEIIKKQLHAVQQGDISEMELTQTKAMLTNQLIETKDNARTIIDFEYNSELVGRERTLDGLLAEIEQTTKEDVRRIAQKIQIDTIYFLRDKEVQ